jgi:hypothetical protein
MLQNYNIISCLQCGNTINMEEHLKLDNNFFISLHKEKYHTRTLDNVGQLTKQ